MADKSKIEWLNGGSTWNPIRARRLSDGKPGWYCQKVSAGCAGCYAEKMNVQQGTNPGRMGNGTLYAIDKLDQVELYLDEKTLLEPLALEERPADLPVLDDRLVRQLRARCLARQDARSDVGNAAAHLSRAHEAR
jgi:hypothetical protein